MTDITPTSLLEVKCISKHFSADSATAIKALDEVSFSISRGESFGLAGISGSGKTLTGRIIMNLMRPTLGEVYFDGSCISDLKRSQMLAYRTRMQMVFQNPLAALNPRKTAGSSLELPLINFGMGSAAERRERVAELLVLVGLSPRHARYYPHEFSGGQCQRIGIARALASSPEFIVLDEPVSALDVSIQAQTLNLLKELQKKLGLTYLFIANNLNVLYFISDRIAVLHAGKIIELAPSEDLFRRPEQEMTKQLLSAMVLFKRGKKLNFSGANAL